MRLTLYSPAADPTAVSEAGAQRLHLEQIAANPQISSPGPIRSTLARVIFACVCVPLALIVGVIAVPLPSEVFQDIRLLILFLSIVACSAYGGVVSGVTGTALAYIGASYLTIRTGDLKHGLSAADSGLLAAEGLAVNLIGWALDVARGRARRKDAELRKLQRQILEVGDEERQRIGHDLHDGLGQQLTGISLFSESLAQQEASGAHPSSADFERITRLCSEAVRQARELARSLSPLTLEQEGFVAAMEELVENTQMLFDIEGEWIFSGDTLAVDPKRAVHLYRIVQEAVSNSVKHGKARHVQVQAVVNGDQLTLTVVDDGSGLSRKTMTNPGLGLRTMAYRARMLGAELTAERAEGTGGTVIRCTCRIGEMSSAGR